MAKCCATEGTAETCGCFKVTCRYYSNYAAMVYNTDVSKLDLVGNSDYFGKPEVQARPRLESAWFQILIVKRITVLST